MFVNVVLFDQLAHVKWSSPTQMKLNEPVKVAVVALWTPLVASFLIVDTLYKYLVPGTKLLTSNS